MTFSQPFPEGWRLKLKDEIELPPDVERMVLTGGTVVLRMFVPGPYEHSSDRDAADYITEHVSTGRNLTKRIVKAEVRLKRRWAEMLNAVTISLAAGDDEGADT